MAEAISPPDYESVAYMVVWSGTPLSDFEVNLTTLLHVCPAFSLQIILPRGLQGEIGTELSQLFQGLGLSDIYQCLFRPALPILCKLPGP